MTRFTVGARKRSALAGIALATTVALAGCGGDDSSPAKKQAAPDKEASGSSQSRAVLTPEPDKDLEGDLGAVGKEALAAGCTFGSFDEQEPEHVAVGSIDAAKDWNSTPPTSGDHYETWGAFGVYDEALDDGYVVHNLEHGGVALWHGPDVPDALTTQLASNVEKGEKWLMVPRAKLDGIVSSAWTKQLACNQAALTKLGDDKASELLDAWFDAVASTGSEAEKDVPAYAGGADGPKPSKDVSLEPPAFG